MFLADGSATKSPRKLPVFLFSEKIGKRVMSALRINKLVIQGQITFKHDASEAGVTFMRRSDFLGQQQAGQFYQAIANYDVRVTEGMTGALPNPGHVSRKFANGDHSYTHNVLLTFLVLSWSRKYPSALTSLGRFCLSYQARPLHLILSGLSRYEAAKNHRESKCMFYIQYILGRKPLTISETPRSATAEVSSQATQCSLRNILYSSNRRILPNLCEQRDAE